MAAASGRRRGGDGGWGSAKGGVTSPGRAETCTPDRTAGGVIQDAAGLKRISTTVLQPAISRLGSSKDVVSWRRKLNHVFASSCEAAAALEESLESLKRSGRSSGGDAALRSRALRDGDSALAEFRKTAQRFETAMRSTGDPAPDRVRPAETERDAAGDDDEARDTRGGPGLVELTEVKSVVSGKARIGYELALEQREDMREVSREIAEVQGLSKDLAEGVAAQSEQVKVVVANVDAALEDVRTGNDSVVRAAEAQRAARRKMCFIAIVVVVILAIILGPTIASATGAI